MEENKQTKKQTNTQTDHTAALRFISNLTNIKFTKVTSSQKKLHVRCTKQHEHQTDPLKDL